MKYGKGAFWKTKKLVARYSEAQTGCPVTYTYNYREVVRFLGKRFKIIRIRKEHIFPYRIKEYRKYKYMREWYFRYLPKFVFQWLENRIGWHLCVTARFRG